MVEYAVDYGVWLGISVLVTLIGAGKIPGATKWRKLHLVIGIANIIACIVAAIANLPS